MFGNLLEAKVLSGQYRDRYNQKRPHSGLGYQTPVAYPEVEKIYVVEDNWPVHFHEDVIGQLQKQQWPWSLNVPPQLARTV